MITKLYEQRLKKDLFRLSILSLITVVFWVGVQTYKALSKSQVKPNVKKQIVPLTPSLDLDTMKDIKKRRQVPEVAWKTIEPVAPAALVLPEALTEPEATESGELESTEATTSASE